MIETISRYKYLPFNEGSLSVLSESTMNFTAPKDFNDPFDCVPDVDKDKYLEHTSKNKALLKEAGNILGYSPAKRIQNKNKLLNNLKKGIEKKSFKEYFSKRIGVCCLSKDPLNLLMWAHYADSHSGFIVEFVMPKSPYIKYENATEYAINHLHPQKVIYTKDKPIIDPFSGDDIDNMEKTFLHKSIDWEYEQEERVIDYLRGPGIHNYDRKILKSVIAGLKMSKRDYKKLEAITEEINNKYGNDVQLYKIEEVPNKFEVHVPNHEKLDSNSSENS